MLFALIFYSFCCCCLLSWNAIISAILIGTLLGLIMGVVEIEEHESERPSLPTEYYPVSSRHRLQRGALASNGTGCAEIGKTIIEKGGSAVDAAISVLLCEGIILPHSVGIGGGSISTIYTRETGLVESLVAREKAPLAATEEMFVDSGEITGAIAAGVPGEILAYWEMHQKYGKLPWRTLIQPIIKLCREGHTVTENLHNTMKRFQNRIQNEPSMREVFINPQTGLVWEIGDVMRRPTLARTFEMIANEGPGSLYNGGLLGKLLAEDVQNMGGIITEEDLKQYRVRWTKPAVGKLKDGHTLYTSPLPAAGALVIFILNIMNPLITTDEPILWQRLVESFKHANGQRTKLGDIEIEPGMKTFYKKLISMTYADEIRKLVKDDSTSIDYSYYGGQFSVHDDHGTASVSVLAPNGDAITVTSTINTLFGAKVRSVNTGIILNDNMDDFCSPGIVNHYGMPSSPANYIKPQKRPLSSMSPSIILDDKGDVQLVIGGAGGTKIVTLLAQIIIRYLYLHQTIEESIQSHRLHHQLAPMYVNIEHGFDKKVIDYLRKVGHTIVSTTPDVTLGAFTAIAVKDFKPTAVFDIRRNGSCEYVDVD